MKVRTKALVLAVVLIGSAATVTALSSWATQSVAARFDHHPALGQPIIAGFYPPFAWITWQQEPWAAEFPRVFLPWRFGSVGLAFGVAGIVLVGAARANRSRKSAIYGETEWASAAEMRHAGLDRRRL